MVAKGGHSLLDPESCKMFDKELIPQKLFNNPKSS